MSDEPAGAEIAKLRADGLSWTDINNLYPDTPRETLRSRYRRLPPTCKATGVQADELPDEDEVYRRAVVEWKREHRLEIRKRSQVLEFDHGPVALAFVADQHFGGSGVDYPRAFAEAELIASTPGMWAGTVGDFCDQFIIGRLMRERLGMRLNIDDEWALTRRYLRILGPKLKLSVSGNHDNWIRQLSGSDYFRSVLTDVQGACIYGTDQIYVTVRIDDREWRGRIRHRWQGKSIYNQTHGIERAAKWDQDFQWGVGAHTHTGACARSFNHAGYPGMALMCGTYKRMDDFAVTQGFPTSCNSMAAVIVFDEETGAMAGYDSLQMACDYMRTMYGDKVES